MKKIILIAAAAFMTLAASAQQKFAHVNFNELVQLMPEAYAARETMSAAQKEAGEAYQSMIDEFQTKYTEYQQKAASWTGAVKESKEKALSEMQTRIQEFEQSVQQELQQQNQQLMAPIYKKANEELQKLAKAGGYVYVFDATSLLYVDPAQSKDLTPDARKALGISDDKTLEGLQQEMQAQAQAQAGAQK